jgi:hypothetical protein
MDSYEDDPDGLAKFYAERMRRDAGPKAEEMIGFKIRDADAEGDARRAGFWRRVLSLAQQ